LRWPAVVPLDPSLGSGAGGLEAVGHLGVMNGGFCLALEHKGWRAGPTEVWEGDWGWKRTAVPPRVPPRRTRLPRLGSARMFGHLNGQTRHRTPPRNSSFGGLAAVLHARFECAARRARDGRTASSSSTPCSTDGRTPRLANRPTRPHTVRRQGPAGSLIKKFIRDYGDLGVRNVGRVSVAHRSLGRNGLGGAPTRRPPPASYVGRGFSTTGPHQPPVLPHHPAMQKGGRFDNNLPTPGKATSTGRKTKGTSRAIKTLGINNS